jgi:hypothetical protein
MARPTIEIKLQSTTDRLRTTYAERSKIRRFETMLLPYSALALNEVRQEYRTGLHPFSYSLDIGPLSPKEKRTVLESNHTPASSTEVKK